MASREDFDRLLPLAGQIQDALRSTMPSYKEVQWFRPDTISVVSAEFDTRLTAGADVNGVAESEQWTRVDAFLISRIELRNREPFLVLTLVEADSLKILAQAQQVCRPADVGKVVSDLVTKALAAWRQTQNSAAPAPGAGLAAPGPAASSPWTRRAVFFPPGGEKPGRNEIRFLRKTFDYWDKCPSLDRRAIEMHRKALEDAIWRELANPRQWDDEWELAAYEFFRHLAPYPFQTTENPHYAGIMKLIFEHRPASLAAAFVHHHLAKRSRNPQEQVSEYTQAIGILHRLQQKYPQGTTYEILWTNAQVDYAQALADAGNLDQAREALRAVKPEMCLTLSANYYFDFGPAPDALQVPRSDLFRWIEEDPVGVLRAQLDQKANGPRGRIVVDAGFEQMALDALFGEVGARYTMGDYQQPIEALQPQLRAIRGGLTFQALKPKLDIYRGYAETVIQDWDSHLQENPDRIPPGTEYIYAFILHAPLAPDERVKLARRAAAAFLKTRRIVISEAAAREGKDLARKMSPAHRFLFFAEGRRLADPLYEELLRVTDDPETMTWAVAYAGFSREFWQQELRAKLIRIFAMNSAQPRPIPPILANQIALRLMDNSQWEDAGWLLEAAMKTVGVAELSREEWRQPLARWLAVCVLQQRSKETEAVMARLPALARVRAHYTAVNGLKRIQKTDPIPGILVRLIQEARSARLPDNEFCCSEPYRDLFALLLYQKAGLDRIAAIFKSCPPSECKHEHEIYYCVALAVFRAQKYKEAAELFELNVRGERYRVDNQFMAALSWALAGQPDKALPLYRDVATSSMAGRRPQLQVLDFSTDHGWAAPATAYMEVKIDMAKIAQLHLRILRERLPLEEEWDRAFRLRGILSGVNVAAQTLSFRGTAQWLVPYPDHVVPFSKLNERHLEYVKKVGLLDNPEIIKQAMTLTIPETMRASGYRPPSAHHEPFRQGPAWENSLGMKFVRIPETELWFSIWETRVQDMEAMTDYRNKENYRRPSHPAIGDGSEFCRWLTRRESMAGRLPAEFYYRLPTRVEWSRAAGVVVPPGLSPEEHKKFEASHFPWGTQWPPPPGAGNYAGEEVSSVTTNELYHFRQVRPFPADWKERISPIAGYRDPYPGVAPVGSFPPNIFGLYDMGGNVAEMTWERERVGGSCVDGTAERLQACNPLERTDNLFLIRPTGFRLVLARRPPGPPSLEVKPIVPGQAWTNSLGMAFSWIEPKNMWAMVRDVTVQDVQMRDSWYPPRPHSEYSRWGNDGMEYAEWVTQLERDRHVLPDTYEYRAAEQPDLTALGLPSPAFNRRLVIHPVGAGKDEAPPPPPAAVRQPVPMASRDFKWQYEMDVGAHTQDLDHNGKGDFWDGGNELPKLENGIAVFEVGDRYRTDFIGSVTRSVLKRNGDCTVEVRVRVHPDSKEGPAGALAVELRDQDNSIAFLYVGK